MTSSTYVLILTLSVKFNGAGMGGVAMHEFSNLTLCEQAGNTWQQSVDNMRHNARTSERIFVCVKK